MATGSMLGPDGKLERVEVDVDKVRGMGRQSTIKDALANHVPDADLRPRWEYKLASVPLYPAPFNELGSDGWELVMASVELVPGIPGRHLFIFKRRLMP